MAGAIGEANIVTGGQDGNPVRTHHFQIIAFAPSSLRPMTGDRGQLVARTRTFFNGKITGSPSAAETNVAPGRQQ
jgi:hypothetical protein